VSIEAGTSLLSIRFDEDGELEIGVDPDDEDLRPKYLPADKFANSSTSRAECEVGLFSFTGLGNVWDEWRAAHCTCDVQLRGPGNADDTRMGTTRAALENDDACSLNQRVEETETVFKESHAGGADDVPSEPILSSDDEGTCSEANYSDEEYAYPGPLPHASKLGVANSEAVVAEMAAEEEVEVATAAATLPWARGALIEALDKSNKWYAAKVCKYDLRRLGNNPRNRRVLIHFLGWGEEFDEWFDLTTDVPAKLRELSPSTEFGPFFHTRFAHGGQGCRFRVAKILEAIGIGNRIGFDSLVRSTFQISIGMIAGEAMKIVRKVARVLFELAREGVVEFSRLAGFVHLLKTGPIGSLTGGTVLEMD
jgi:hypothetical protein